MFSPYAFELATVCSAEAPADASQRRLSAARDGNEAGCRQGHFQTLLPLGEIACPKSARGNADNPGDRVTRWVPVTELRCDPCGSCRQYLLPQLGPIEMLEERVLERQSQ